MDGATLAEVAKTLGFPVCFGIAMLLMFSRQQSVMFDKFGELLELQQKQQESFSSGLVGELKQLRDTLEKHQERFFRVLERNSLWLERQTQESAIQTHLQQQQNDKLGHIEVVAKTAAEVAERTLTH